MKRVLPALLLAACSGHSSLLPVAPLPTTISDPGAFLAPDVPDLTTRRHDWGNLPDGYMISDSIVHTPGSLYATDWTFNPFWPFDAARGDGGEVYQISGDTVTISDTQDGGTPGIQHFQGAECGWSGWVVFKTDAPTGSWASLVAKLNDKPAGSPCTSANPAFTRYRVESVAIPFLIGGVRQDITTPTVISEHYDDTTLDNSTDMERSFFAQGVGRVIWEAWSKNPHPGADLPERCPGTAYSVAPAPGWVFEDCRTNTNVQPAGGTAPSGWPWLTNGQG